MSFNNVSPGEAWKPEPAERYNAVNALLNNATNTVISPGGGLPNNIIMGYVPQDVDVSAYEPVFLEKLYSDKDPGFELLNGQCCMEVSKKGDNTKPFGIALGSKSSGTTSAFIPIQVYGLAVMTSSHGDWETGDFASPVVASGSWQKQNNTDIPCGVVIAPPKQNKLVGGYLGVISLPPLFKNYFSGTFKLVAIDKNSFKVVDGANPESPVCGKIGGLHPDFPLEVPAQTFSGNGELWLVIHYKRSYNESDGTYSVKYSVKWSRSYTAGSNPSTPNAEFDFYQLKIGSFRDGVCYQDYKDGDFNLTNQGWYL